MKEIGKLNQNPFTNRIIIQFQVSLDASIFL